MNRDGGLKNEMEEQERVIELGQRKKQKLLQLAATGELSDRDFLSMNRQCTAEIEQAQKRLLELNEQYESAGEFKKHIETIRRVLKDAERDAAKGIISKDFVDKYIDKIIATMEDDGTMRLQIKIFTGETTEKYLQNLKSRAGQMNPGRKNTDKNAGTAMDSEEESRTGHTFKKMIEAYEQGLK